MHTSKIFIILFFLVCSVGPVFGFSTHNVPASRTFDKIEATVNDFITVTFNITNLETPDLRGFYYTEQIPEGMSVNTINIKIGGAEISNYFSELGSVGDVYPSYIPYHWILEIPPSFEDDNPISNDSIVEIVYTVSSAQAGTFQFNEFQWVGYYQETTEGEKTAFGHSEDNNKQMMTFIIDTDNDGVPDSTDNCSDTYNPNQHDTYPPQGNGIGDACDCECDFDCDGDVDAADVETLLVDFGRFELNNPCANDNQCNGDCECDGDVDADDVEKFLEDFGRFQLNNPCPACVAGDWCVYE